MRRRRCKDTVRRSRDSVGRRTQDRARDIDGMTESSARIGGIDWTEWIETDERARRTRRMMKQ